MNDIDRQDAILHDQSPVGGGYTLARRNGRHLAGNRSLR
jgi:hypothetical protein